MSRPYKFEVHTLVTGPFSGVGVVDKNTGAASKGELEKCWVRHRPYGNMPDLKVACMPYHEGDLTRASFWQA